MARTEAMVLENRVVSDNLARAVLRNFAPRAYRNAGLLERSLVELRKLYDARPLMDGRTFADFVRCFAENAAVSG